MKAEEESRLCQEAQVYYYDFLCRDEAAVPEPVRRHLAACPVCRERLGRLREALFQAQRAPGPADREDDETIEALAQQFRLLDERVGCTEVKPFLPELLLPSPRLRIPTPVTVHVDHCPQCAEDLATLRDLDLDPDQLQRLSRLFRSPHHSGPWEAPQTTGGAKLLSATPVEGRGILCRDLAWSDLFDCVVPDCTAAGERQEAVAAHVRTCPRCQARAQTLDNTIRSIRERTDSETTTVYHARNEAEQARAEARGPSRYPIDVQVLHGTTGSEAGGRSSALGRMASRWKQEWSGGRLTKAAVVTVALAALLALRWGEAPVASGTAVTDILNVLGTVPYAHLLTTYPQNGASRESWIAYRENRMLTETKRECILYDLDRGRKETLDLATGARSSEELTRPQREQIRQLMIDRLRDVMTQVSLDTTLHPPTGELEATIAGNFKIYEAICQRPNAPVPLRTGLRVYVDPVKGLPHRMEFHQEGPGDTPGTRQWQCTTTTMFLYPDEKEVTSHIRELFPDE